jgi:hypothetical protein
MLLYIVEKIEKKDFLSFPITLTVPGGVYSGELISTSRFIEEMNETINIRAVDPLTDEVISEFSLSEAGSEIDTSPVQNPVHLHLLKPCILNASFRSQPVQLPFGRIAIDAVSGWCYGRLTVEG